MSDGNDLQNEARKKMQDALKHIVEAKRVNLEDGELSSKLKKEPGFLESRLSVGFGWVIVGMKQTIEKLWLAFRGKN